MYLKFVELRRSSAMLLLIADVGLDEGVGDPGPHGAQGSFKVSGLDALGFDVVLQRQEGGLPAHRGYLRQETDTDIQLSGAERPPCGRRGRAPRHRKGYTRPEQGCYASRFQRC